MPYSDPDEQIANALRIRANELEDALDHPMSDERTQEVIGELVDVNIALDRLYRPMETYATAKLCARFGNPL